jgi:hypothetical protein
MNKNILRANNCLKLFFFENRKVLEILITVETDIFRSVNRFLQSI